MFSSYLNNSAHVLTKNNNLTLQVSSILLIKENNIFIPIFMLSKLNIILI